MKRFLFLIAVLCSMTLFAETIDINKSEGTGQSVIESLRPAPASPEVDADITIEAIFSEALNPMTARRSVRLKRLSGTESRKGRFGFGPFGSDKSVSGTTDYDPDRHAVTFTPDRPLDVGFYEVSFRHLMTQKPGMTMRIDPIVYRFYVPEVINGFKLPPEPDPKENDATLLGIDFNHNGIRDDVERLIIIEEAKNTEFPKTQTAISLQYAYAWQKMIETPTIESRKYLEDASACQWYFFDRELKSIRGYKNRRKWRREHYGELGVHLEDAIFNTKERILRRFEFNRACSGHIFDLSPASIDKCMINIDTLGE